MFENLINYCSSFILLSAIDKEALALNFKHTTIKRNDFLLKEGKVCDFIAFVNSGVIRCLSPLNDWTDFLIQFRTLNLGNHEYKT